MNDYKDSRYGPIPRRFLNAGTHLAVATVQEVIDALKELPPDLPVGFGEPLIPVVYNVSQRDVHLTFEEYSDYADEWDDDDCIYQDDDGHESD